MIFGKPSGNLGKFGAANLAGGQSLYISTLRCLGVLEKNAFIEVPSR
jgi:hypothetical protein